MPRDKITREHFEFAFTSALIGIVMGCVCLLFAFVLLFKEQMPWLAFGAACYGVAMIWMGWSVGKIAEREAITREEEQE